MSGAWPAENLADWSSCDHRQAAIEAGREVTPQVGAVNRKAAVEGSRWAPATGSVPLNRRRSAPGSVAECPVARVRPSCDEVAGARVGRGQCVVLLSLSLATARTAGHRDVRRSSRPTGDPGRREGMISSRPHLTGRWNGPGRVRSSQRYGRAMKVCAPFAWRDTTARPAAHLRRWASRAASADLRGINKPGVGYCNPAPL